MAFPLIPLALAGGAAWATSAWGTRASIQDGAQTGEFVPRWGNGDSRWWGLGLGLLGLFTGGVMPLLGSALFGVGVGSLLNFSNSATIKQAWTEFSAMQAGGPMAQLPGPGIPGWGWMTDAARSAYEGATGAPGGSAGFP